ncbi:decaprenyl-diphosphate synthase subunit 1 isoform X2 [Hemibagrus wyckioides]|uniref:decaprenyl-diphosphate synthase subunit 1 isoform X2 n=1 Tax=Hemibagrus wyckioides TaxID=337641 RepID=UPI00266C211C|nr:decaprenyl-diphosphate synthase subunit 1 isoform X2 [Hemibagrus wyckioides]
MAVQWWRCWRGHGAFTGVIDAVCGVNRRPVTAGARGTGAGCLLKEVLLPVRHTHNSIRPSAFTGYRSRYLSPVSRSCCCCRIHSDAKLKDPFSLAQEDLTNLYEDIKKLLVSRVELKALCDYYFDGKGKAFRPMIVVLMARACNIHSNRDGDLLPAQRSIAMISEMIHTASLVHDDVIDGADIRRGKTTINEVWGERKAILAGDFILSAASMALARIGNTSVVSVLSQVIEDLVRVSPSQVNSCSWDLKKTRASDLNTTSKRRLRRRRVLSLTAVKQYVSILVNSDPEVHEIAYQYGRNVGIAFQLVDDMLDFTSCANQLGKPSAADLRLGLATGPVLFACQQFPELHSMIMRRFGSDGDVDRAWRYVLESDGVEQTNFLAQRYCHEATRQISRLQPSPERDALIRLTELVLNRDK